MATALHDQPAQQSSAASPAGTRAPALIHVGVRKAASSYLQAWFANHLGCSYTTAPELVELTLRLARADEPLPALLSHPHDLPALGPARPLTPQRRLVISNEKFAMYAFGSDGFSAEFCHRYMTLACALLKQACPEGRVLILTRGPRAWITSAYHQYVRWPNRVRPFGVFLRTSWPYLRANLDYQFLRDLYTGAFGDDRVLMLPQEMLEADPAAFLARVESFGDIDGGAGMSGRFQNRPRNVSLGAADMEKLRRLRGLLRALHRDTPRPDRDNYFKNKVLRGEHTIDDFLGDVAACFLYEADPRIDRVLRLVLDSLPAPPRPAVDRTIPASKLAALARRCRFLAQLPEYRDHGEAYLLGG